MNLVFEQPLNEKTRNYLRIESVGQHLNAHADFNEFGSDLAFFRTLFELMELVDRGELRNEITKDLEQKQSAITQWRNFDEVDQQQLNQLEHNIDYLLDTLIQQRRPVQQLKSDPFLSALKQRLTIPGGFCSFDLPQFSFWQDMSLQQKTAARDQWLNTLAPIMQCIDLLLEMLRETGKWQNKMALSGCIQETNEQDIDLLRVEIKREYGVYPAISAHRSRFTIHLINFETGKGDNRNIPLKLSLSLENK